MGYLGNAPADQAVQIGTGSVEEQDIIDNVIVRTMATSVNTISSDLTLNASSHNITFGDVTISGANTDVTVPSGSTWTIL